MSCTNESHGYYCAAHTEGIFKLQTIEMNIAFILELENQQPTATLKTKAQDATNTQERKKSVDVIALSNATSNKSVPV